VITLTIYSKPGCHLCDDMKAIVDRVVRSSRQAVTVEEIDISRDRALEERYGLEIPVLMLDGRKIAKYRVSEADLTRAIVRAGGAGRAGEAGGD
jgi:glutaredoxin